MPIAGSGNYLYDFGQMLQQQFNLNDNKNAVFNTATDAPGSSGTLGDLSGGFDQSAQRSYTEQGFSSVIPFNPTPKQLDILSQNPDITVLIKKSICLTRREFSTRCRRPERFGFLHSDEGSLQQ